MILENSDVRSYNISESEVVASCVVALDSSRPSFSTSTSNKSREARRRSRAGMEHQISGKGRNGKVR